MAYGGSWGHLNTRFDPGEGLIVVTGYSKGQSSGRSTVQVPWLDDHYSKPVSVSPFSGYWYRADPELHVLGYQAHRRASAVTLDFFRANVKGFRSPHQTLATFVITVCEVEGQPDFAGWGVTVDGAARFSLDVVDDDPDLFLPLGEAWPREKLASPLVTVIGVGSIGSAACEALSGYAIRNLALVDPDRLKEHNFARHRANPRDIGRYKVNAVANALQERDKRLKVERYPLDVVHDADTMRPLFRRSSSILVCSDGVESRRVANHLACRAGTRVVFACVLEDGAFGEVLQVRPGVTACLFCSREQLVEKGAMDPEPSLDAGYTTGQRHLPMTAVGGDLDFVGKFAARVAVSGILESLGYLKEKLPGDQAVIGLRPPLEKAEAPFDVEHTLMVSWNSLGRPSPDCPSCGGES